MSYRYFAFIDLLGYKELIARDLKNGTSELKDKLIASFAAINHINEADIDIKAISDSIFLTLSNEDRGFSFFASVICQLQLAFLSNGLLLRGGISYNQHFIAGKVTYSPALLDAYKIESTQAFFPRIIIHPAVIEKLNNEQKLSDILTEKTLIRHSSNYQTNFLKTDNWASAYKHAREIANSDRNQIESDPRIYAKHWYLQDYLKALKPKGATFRPYLSAWS